MSSEGTERISAAQALRDELKFVPRNIPAAASEARRAKRALVKAFGIRQYKKVKV